LISIDAIKGDLENIFIVATNLVTSISNQCMEFNFCCRGISRVITNISNQRDPHFEILSICSSSVSSVFFLGLLFSDTSF
jgi:hypothetical protein